MSAPRLTLLYPKFLRGPIISEIGPLRTSVRQKPQQYQACKFSTSVSRREEVRQQRYGNANEPPPHIIGRRGGGKDAATQAPPAKEEEKQSVAEKKDANTEKKAEAEKKTDERAASEEYEEAKPMQPNQEAITDRARPIEMPPLETPLPIHVDTPPSKPLETILQMPPHSEEAAENKPPHLAPPRYVHHFDTWSLVKDLEKGGFNRDVSVDLMKAVRGILSENMELARKGLVSKSNVENETYLFRAACSELKTEIQNNRRTEMEKLRAQRTQLQHEVDILNQRFMQEMAGLKDELRGMFDDRKMTVKMEQKNFESKIQELNYKIQVVLNSDARTEVEGIRWVLTRRAAGALALAVVMILSALNYSRYMTQTQEKERKKHAEAMHRTAVSGLAPLDSVGGAGQGGAMNEEALLAGDGVTTG